MPEQESNRSAIYEWIVERTPQGGRVLDIGCGEGDLLARLVERRKVRAVGIELSEACVMKAVQRGLSVHHGDVEEGLNDYGDRSFDLVLFSLTIQELGDPLRALQEAFRVGKKAIIVFPNFGHWRARWQLAVLGQAPRTANLPYTWYESPNRHFVTIADWDNLCARQGWRTLDRGFVSQGRIVRVLPNLFAEVAMYLLEKQQ